MPPRSRPAGPTQAQVDLHKFDRRYDLFEKGLYVVGTVLGIAAATLPIHFFLIGLRPFAGKSTRVRFTAGVSVTVALSVVVNVGQGIRSASRKRTITKLRTRQTELEDQVRTLQGP